MLSFKDAVKLGFGIALGMALVGMLLPKCLMVIAFLLS